MVPFDPHDPAERNSTKGCRSRQAHQEPLRACTFALCGWLASAVCADGAPKVFLVHHVAIVWPRGMVFFHLLLLSLRASVSQHQQHVRGKKFHAVLSHVDLTEVLDEIVGSKASSSHQAPWTFGRLGAVLQVCVYFFQKRKTEEGGGEKKQQKMGASEDSQQCATLAQRKMGLPSRAMFSKVTASIFDSTTDIIVPSSPVILDNSKNITFTLPSSPALPPPADMITPPPAVVERILPKSPASKPIVVSSSFNRPPQVTSKFSLSTSDDENDEENDLSSGKGPAKVLHMFCALVNQRNNL